ncbi:hypothetical protein GPECTOR_11g35 [Gonium pectorale]|uniref:ELMO domain-containing protein n=1 Tax=Gonium pectorale TaxID=33097 RepID=A0A150GPZ1_GONPE|nr:hypothetical protein GPECTOR_11g35 [Gonium pectorale]|eukprot:KXZ51907.1 hypothetical protein GPECTOR_11g35 [Gonium pectorale]
MVGTLRAAQRKADDDDEFSYAFEGGKREGEFHKQVFRPKAMPAHLVTNVKQNLKEEVLAEEEEEEEEEDEEEEEEEDPTAADSATRRVEEARQSQSKDVRPMNSWTTFAVSSSHMDNVADDVSSSAAGAKAGQAGALESLEPPQPGAGVVAAPVAKQLAEDLPSFRLMQALASPGKRPGLAGAADEEAGRSASDGKASASGAGAPQPLPPSPRGKPPLASPKQAGVAEANGAAPKAPVADAAARANGGAAAVPAARSAEAVDGAVARPGARAPVGGAAVAAAAAAEEDEWEAANRERRREMGLGHGANLISSGGASASTPHDPSSPLTYHEALLYFMAMDVSATRGSVASTLPPPPGFFSRLLCLGPPDLRPTQLRDQLLQLLCLAKLTFDNEQVMHVRLLGSVFSAFTGMQGGAAGKTPDQPRFGGHWADVGFQGQDPATDLRGCGMLGLVQLFYLPQWSGEGAAKARRGCVVPGWGGLVGMAGDYLGEPVPSSDVFFSDPPLPPIYRLSRHPVQEFPLAIVSLNVTKWTLQALRSGTLNRAANSRGSMVEAAQLFYAGAMATFYSTWLKGGKTMADSGHVLRELENLAAKKPGLILAAGEQTHLPDPPEP